MVAVSMIRGATVGCVVAEGMLAWSGATTFLPGHRSPSEDGLAATFRGENRGEGVEGGTFSARKLFPM